MSDWKIFFLLGALGWFVGCFILGALCALMKIDYSNNPKKLELMVSLWSITVIVVAYLAYADSSSNNHAEKNTSNEIISNTENKKLTPLDALIVSEVDKSINVKKLADAFILDSQNTDIQRELMLKDISGKVAEIEVVVYEVAREGTKYKVRAGIEKQRPFMLIYVTPRNENDIAALQQVLTDQKLVFRVRFTGKTNYLRTLVIDPAVLITEDTNEAFDLDV